MLTMTGASSQLAWTICWFLVVTMQIPAPPPPNKSAY